MYKYAMLYEYKQVYTIHINIILPLYMMLTTLINKQADQILKMTNNEKLQIHNT